MQSAAPSYSGRAKIKRRRLPLQNRLPSQLWPLRSNRPLETPYNSQLQQRTMLALCHLNHRRIKATPVRKDGMAANKVTAVRMGILAVSSRCQGNSSRRAKGALAAFFLRPLVGRRHHLSGADCFWPGRPLERISDIAAAPELTERCRDLGNDSCWRPRRTIWKVLTRSKIGRAHV